LWRRVPKIGWARRMKAAGLAVLLGILLVPLMALAQSNTAPAPTAITAPAANATPNTYWKGLDAPDPTGARAGTWAAPAMDQKGDDPSKLTTSDVYDRVVHNVYSINMVWVLFAGFLIMFMHLGFAMIETGLTRAKNAAHTFAMNMMVYPLGCLGFFIYGFALGWGNWFNQPKGNAWYSSLGPGTGVLNHPLLTINGWTILGGKGFFLTSCQDVSVLGLFFFMTVFMNITATIPTGTMCERWRWNSFCLYGLFVALPFSIFGCWAWGGGWLAQLGVKAGLGHGYVDFAGSGVVHLMGGIIGLIGAILLGPRIGKFVNGKAVAIPGHNLPMVMGGTFVLAFGWFGFNPGSSLSGTDLRIAFIVVNTLLAGGSAAVASMAVMQYKFGKPDPSMMCNGLLAGLVAITAPCAFVTPISACIIGAVAGVLVVYSVFFWDNMGVDDPVGAVSVHGASGLWGVLSVGLFAAGDYGRGWNGVNLDGYAGNVVGILPFASVSGAPFLSPAGWGQLAAQAVGGLSCIVVGGVLSYGWFKVSNRFVPLRVRREAEIQGCDIPEMGAGAYPDFELKTTHSYAGVASVPMKY
jgi:Amt family ammonium transporter